MVNYSDDWRKRVWLVKSIYLTGVSVIHLISFSIIIWYICKQNHFLIIFFRLWFYWIFFISICRKIFKKLSVQTHLAKVIFVSIYLFIRETTLKTQFLPYVHLKILILTYIISDQIGGYSADHVNMIRCIQIRSWLNEVSMYRAKIIWSGVSSDPILWFLRFLLFY